MTNMLSNTNKVTSFLPGIRREGRIIHQVIDRFVPAKLEEGTDIIGGACKDLNRDGT
jgi:hypothetical protein